MAGGDARVEKVERRRSVSWRAALVIMAVAALVFLGRAAGGRVQEFARWIEQIGPWGPVVFILGYVVASVAFIPGSLLTLAAGAIFGLVRGVLYVFIAATTGSAAAFLASRYLVRGAIERRISDNHRFAAIDRAVGTQGLKIVLLLRLSPIFPFNLLNYALGLSKVRLIDYLIASVGMLPGTILYVYYGKLAGDVAALTAGTAPPRGMSHYIILVGGLAATIAVSTIVTRLARAALKDATQERPGGASNMGENL